MARHLLDTLADLMIPNDFGRNLPSGSSVDLEAILLNENMSDDAIKSAEQFSDLVSEKLNKSLDQLTMTEFEELCRSSRAQVDPILKIVGPLLLKAYYTDPRVQVGLGIGSAPPFPSGISVEAGNLELLESVFNRGSIYRSVNE